jgi:hypothetical protein
MTAPKLPEGLEPVALPPDLEALMPEPKWHSPTPGDAAHFPYFTADQVRAAILGATERAAKVVEQVGPKEGALKLVAEGFAAAIRGDRGAHD